MGKILLLAGLANVFISLVGASPGQPYQALVAKQKALLAKIAALRAEMKERFIDTPHVCEGRLTTEPGVALSTSDRTNQSTLYFTPYKGARVSLYNGSYWTLYDFSETSLVLSGLSAATQYDVFAYSNAGSLTLELGPAWSSNTARSVAGALTSQDGIRLLGSDTTRRYLGTIRATAATQTQDSAAQRFVWNQENRLTRYLYVRDTTNTWTYNSNSWRAANGSGTNLVEYIVGNTDVLVKSRVMSLVTNASGTVNYYSAGIGIDTTTANSAQMRGSGTDNNMLVQAWGEYQDYSALGYHSINWLERGDATSQTVWGDNGDGTRYQSGLIAEVNG